MCFEYQDFFLGCVIRVKASEYDIKGCGLGAYRFWVKSLRIFFFGVMFRLNGFIFFKFQGVARVCVAMSIREGVL